MPRLLQHCHRAAFNRKRLELPGAGPFSPMPGRTMSGYAVLPEDVVADDTAIDDWVGRAIALGKSLPAK